MGDLKHRRSITIDFDFATQTSTSTMNPNYFLVLLSLSILTTLALPVADDAPPNRSLGQHLGQVGLWIFGGLGAIAMAIGTITYGTNWFHRFKTMQAELQQNMTTWNTTQLHKDQEHLKHMEALDIILDVTHSYSDNLGKEKTEFDPLEVADTIEEEIKQAQDKLEKEKT